MRVAAQITKTNMVGIATSRMRLLRRLIRLVRFSFMKNGLTCSESMVKAKNFLCYLLHRQKCVGHDKLFFCIICLSEHEIARQPNGQPDERAITERADSS